jgi:hypothetical protein
MTIIAYPRLLLRVRAALIDSVLLPLIVLTVLILGSSSFELSGGLEKLMLIFIPIFILEPCMVAFTGGTVGHHFSRIRVVARDGSRNINILAATIRFVVKLLVGWLSFIFVLKTIKHQALHDLVVGSIVIHKDPTGLPLHEALPERTPVKIDYVYPAVWRRVVAILLYSIFCTFAMVAISTIVMIIKPISWFVVVIVYVWMISLAWVAVRGWFGRLPGCERRPRDVA